MNRENAIGRIGWLSLPLRAAFTLVFLIFSSAQPSMFAGSGAEGIGHGLAMKMAAAGPAAHHADGHDHGDGHSHGVQKNGQGSSPPADGSASMSCEVHCAPAHAMPVACPDIAPNFARCFAPIASDTLKQGEFAEFIHPPRRLI